MKTFILPSDNIQESKYNGVKLNLDFASIIFLVSERNYCFLSEWKEATYSFKRTYTLSVFVKQRYKK